jgi:non-ribosomal peptide synthetase component F
VLATTQEIHPPRTAGPSRDDQRRAALAQANAVRTARAALRRAVHDGDRRAADIIAEPPPEARSMPVGELLAAQHRWGDARASRILRRVPVPETKVLAALTPRQRAALVALLGGESAEGGLTP